MKPPNTLLAVLREDVLPGLLAQHPYISLAAVKAELKRQRRAAGPNTLKQYLAKLKREGVVHDAGKGWYTSVKEPFEVNPAPVAPLVSLLEAKYPLLDFACWSTEQVKSYVHLTLTRFASFVYVERHNRSAVFETLREAGGMPGSTHRPPKPVRPSRFGRKPSSCGRALRSSRLLAKLLQSRNCWSICMSNVGCYP